MKSIGFAACTILVALPGEASPAVAQKTPPAPPLVQQINNSN